MIGKVLGRSAIMAAALTAIAPAHAVNFMFTTGTSSAQFGSITNSVVLPGTISVTATGWSTTGLLNTNAPTQAYVGRYTNGLGVTVGGTVASGGEGDGSVNNAHTIDNVGGYDFVRLVFSQAVNLTGMTRVGFDVNGAPQEVDGDYWLSYGGDGTFDTTAKWQGYMTRGVNYEQNEGFTNTNFSTVWLIGAARVSTDRDDGFKLSSVTANAQPAVPEPATWLTLILGFGAIGQVVRKRSQVAAKVRAFLTGTLGRKLLAGPAA